MLEGLRKSEAQRPRLDLSAKLQETSEQLLDGQKDLGNTMAETLLQKLNDPNISPEQKVEFAQKMGDVIARYGETMAVGLETATGAMERASHPLMRTVHAAVDHASEASGTAIKEVGQGIAAAAGAHVKELGAGAASATKDISIALLKVIAAALPLAGRGVGGLLRGLYDGFKNPPHYVDAT